ARYAAAPDFYTVRSGDTLSGIAARYGLSYISVAETLYCFAYRPD
ncbi:LysM domain-containing protein, partial [Staphylococcus aureus]